jgi:steroid delta-isomerase-like uncharacterized protein
MSAHPNAELAKRYHMDLFLKGDLSAADAIFTRDFVLHVPGLPPELARGPEGLKAFATLARSAFHEQVILHHDTIVTDDRVVIRWTVSGKHLGPYMGIPPTEKEVTFSGIDIFRVANGKLAEGWGFWDQVGLLQQLGALTKPGNGT